jgi:hypothetical protein
MDQEGNKIVTTVPESSPDSPVEDGVGHIARLRLSQDFARTSAGKKVLLTVPVRKPNRQEFIRVHPDMRFEAAVLTLKEEREAYIVAPELRDDLVGEWAPTVLLLALSRQNVVFIWPLKLPGEDGRLDPWNESALGIADLATRSWLRVVSNRGLGAYEAFQTVTELPDPEWPDRTIEELIDIAFRGRIIDRADHPVLRRLRGEI